MHEMDLTSGAREFYDIEDTDNVEEQDSEEGLSDSGWDSLPWVLQTGQRHQPGRKHQTHLGLSDCDSDELGTHVREQSEHESVDETGKLAEVTLDRPGPVSESPAIFPVSEADSLLSWHTSEVDDQTEEDETGEGEDLDHGEPESAEISTESTCAHSPLTRSLRTT